MDKSAACQSVLTAMLAFPQFCTALYVFWICVVLHSDGSSVWATDSLHLQGDATGNFLFTVDNLLFFFDVHLLTKNIK